MLAFWSPGWTIAGCLLAAAVALAARHRLARAASLGVRQAGAYLLGIGVAISITVSPRSVHDTYYVFGPMSRRCEPMPSVREVMGALTTAEWGLNLVLFLPVGWVCASAARRGSRWRLLGVAAAVPVAIEVVQYLVTDLHRVCQGRDLVANWLGLAAGFCASAARRHPAGRGRSRTSRHADGPPGDQPVCSQTRT